MRGVKVKQNANYHISIHELHFVIYLCVGHLCTLAFFGIFSHRNSFVPIKRSKSKLHVKLHRVCYLMMSLIRHQSAMYIDMVNRICHGLKSFCINCTAFYGFGRGLFEMYGTLVSS